MRGQVIEQREVFGDDSCLAFDFQSIVSVPWVFTQQGDLAGRGNQDARQHLDGRRLASSIGAQESIQTAALDGEIDRLHGVYIVKVPCELFRFDGKCHRLAFVRWDCYVGPQQRVKLAWIAPNWLNTQAFQTQQLRIATEDA